MSSFYFKILFLKNRIGTSNFVVYTYFSNGIWNILVAMTTVGYGEFVPQTAFGRYLILVSIVIGTLIMSLTVVALFGISSFNENEDRAFMILNRLNYRKELYDSCQKIIYIQFKLHSLRKSNDAIDIQTSSEYSHLCYELKKETYKKLEITKKLQSDFNSDMDKVRELESQLSSNIKVIKDHTPFFQEIMINLKKQSLNQLKLLENLENTLKLTRYQYFLLLYF